MIDLMRSSGTERYLASSSGQLLSTPAKGQGTNACHVARTPNIHYRAIIAKLPFRLCLFSRVEQPEEG